MVLNSVVGFELSKLKNLGRLSYFVLYNIKKVIHLEDSYGFNSDMFWDPVHTNCTLSTQNVKLTTETKVYPPRRELTNYTLSFYSKHLSFILDVIIFDWLFQLLSTQLSLYLLFILVDINLQISYCTDFKYSYICLYYNFAHL